MKENNHKINELLTRGVAEIIKKKSLIKKLNSGKKLRIKHGVDPTTKDLHLGHAVVYEKLRQFQELGHQVIFLIGDFTGRFGDPSQRLEARKLREKSEVREMAKNYLSQAGKILDLKKLAIRYNSEWYDKMPGEEFLRLMSYFTVQRMLERDMFKERIKKGKEIRFHEPVYPVLQAYDSVVLKAEVEVGGTDQLFNCLRGRDLQKEFRQSPQDVLTTKILIGIDGKQKMSQSFRNYIGLEEKPEIMFGKVMSIPDQLIGDYFELVTRVPLEEIGKCKKDLKQKKVNPRDLKAALAREIITIYHGKEAARKAEKEFERIFKEKKLPTRIPELQIKEKSLNILDLLVKTKLASSKSEAKRLVLQKGVKIDGKIRKNWQETIQIKKGQVLQVGKRKFAKVA